MWSFRGSFPVGEGVRSHREYDDHLVCSENLKGKFQDVRNVWRTRHESDHCLRVMELRLGGKEFAPAKQKGNVGRAPRRVDVGEAVGVALRKAMPDMCGDDARAPQAGGNRSGPKPRGRRSVTNAATGASAINNKARAASGAETSTAEDMDLHASGKPSRRWHTRCGEMAGSVGKSSEIRYQGMTETTRTRTLALIADRTAWRMKLAGSRGTEQQQQRTRVLKQKIQHSVRKDKRIYSVRLLLNPPTQVPEIAKLQGARSAS